MPEAIVAFLDSADVEHAIRLAISLGGDSDTQAAIAGGIAHAFYRYLPQLITNPVRQRLPAEFIEVIDDFELRSQWPPAVEWHIAVFSDHGGLPHGVCGDRLARAAA